MRKKEFGMLLLITSLTVACSKQSINKNRKIEPRIVFQDSFSTNQGWITGTQDGVSYGFNNGKYEIKINKEGWLSWAYAPYSNSINFNYSIKADCVFQLDDNSKMAMGGFIFNYIDNNNCSIAAITNNGYCRIFQVKNGTINNTTNWISTPSINILAGSINKLEILQRTSNAELLINGEPATSLSIGRINSNVKVGLLAWTEKGADFAPIVTSFDNFILSATQ